ncbi:MAG: glycoside hydrolase family 25 protein [Chthoniobacterales bacterium]
MIHRRLACLSFLSLLALPAAVAWAESNSVVNLSHYDLLRPDFGQMRAEGIVGVIHEATYPRGERDEYYASRQEAAVRAGMLWGAYHFANSSDPVAQANQFLATVQTAWRQASPGSRPNEVLLVLDFEKNGHYPGGTMNVKQAVQFAEHIRQRTGVYPGIYSNENRVRSVLGSLLVPPAQKRALTNCWLWIANYHYVPRSFSPWHQWTMWQYTGDGKCDLPRASYPKGAANVRNAERNIFRGSTSELVSFWQSHGWKIGADGE